jgi:hypothetical protein
VSFIVPVFWVEQCFGAASRVSFHNKALAAAVRVRPFPSQHSWEPFAAAFRI